MSGADTASPTDARSGLVEATLVAIRSTGTATGGACATAASTGQATFVPKILCCLQSTGGATRGKEVDHQNSTINSVMVTLVAMIAMAAIKTAKCHQKSPSPAVLRRVPGVAGPTTSGTEMAKQMAAHSGLAVVTLVPIR